MPLFPALPLPLLPSRAPSSLLLCAHSPTVPVVFHPRASLGCAPCLADQGRRRQLRRGRTGRGEGEGEGGRRSTSTMRARRAGYGGGVCADFSYGCAACVPRVARLRKKNTALQGDVARLNAECEGLQSELDEARRRREAGRSASRGRGEVARIDALEVRDVWR